jgi:hypothetical protein
MEVGVGVGVGKKGQSWSGSSGPEILGKLGALPECFQLDEACTERQGWVSAGGNPSGWVLCD